MVLHGWKAVARDPDVFLKGVSPANSKAYTLEDLKFPETKLVQATQDFAKKHLPEPTFNHSQRVYIYGPTVHLVDSKNALTLAIGAAIVKSHFPSHDFDFETYYLASLLHDIGTAPAYFKTTKMSFEFKGGIVGREFLIKNGAPEDQADQICETVIRHQDIFVEGGNITEIGQIIQLATILGARLQYVTYLLSLIIFETQTMSDCEPHIHNIPPSPDMANEDTQAS